MNTLTTAEKLELILADANPDIRDKLSLVLNDCGFRSADDPGLNALLAQAMLANQPLRLVTEGGTKVATSTDMARLGDRVEAVLDSILSIKWHNILLAFALFYLVGLGTTVVAFKIWPNELAAMFDLPKVVQPDPRIAILDKIGARLVVETNPKDNITYLYFKGKIQPQAKVTGDGLNFFEVTP
jgi:hypothetical protein